MTPPPIAYDMVRLVLGPTLPVPRGIDRVDLGYARYFFETWPGDCFGVLPLPFGLLGGVVVIKRQAALTLLNHIAALWGETGDAASDPALAFVRARLADADADFLQPRPPHHFRPHRILTGLLTAAFRLGGIAGLRLRGALPTGTVYVNTGQLGLGFDWTTAWLRRRPDMRRVYMLHDAIPLENPEMVTQSGHDLHARMIANTARDADGLIVTTEAVRLSVLRELARCGRDVIPALAAPLPVAPLFLTTDQPPASPVPYFVVVGSIEPRKNHALLLQVWKNWQGAPPRLVIVGTPWREAEKVLDEIAADPRLRRSVITVAGLTSPALRALLQGACALLQPSLVEGFGLPVIEALAVGTPVIASDQPSHREAGGDFATYLDATDADAWGAAIAVHLNGERRAGLAAHRPWDWDRYGAAVGPFIASVARLEGPQARLR